MYGADAVYCALPEFGMRAAPVNLTVGELREGCIFAHARGKKVYLTLNTLPTNEELSKEMGISVEKIREAKKAAQDPISLETPIGEKEDSHLGDFIEDQKTASPEDEAAATMRREQVYKMLDTLTEREKGVLALRFGMDDGTPRTLEEVGKHFGVTRERIRQIEGKALKKLKKQAMPMAGL